MHHKVLLLLLLLALPEVPPKMDCLLHLAMNY